MSIPENEAMRADGKPDVKINNEEASESGLFNAASKSSSDLLRKARKDKGVTVETVADELNLSSSVVRAIESDNWEALPEATYVRGYVRSYANFLGLDVNDVLMNFKYKNSEADLNLDAMPRGFTDSESSNGAGKLIKWLLILGVLATGVYSIFGDDIKNLATKLTNSPLTQTQTQSTNSSEEVREEPVASNDVKTSVEATKNAGKVVTNELKQVINLSFTGISWVDISDKNDRKVIYKSFAPGEKIKVKAEKPLKIFIGNVAAVEMSYEGKSIPIKDHQEEDHAKFTLE